MIDIFFPTVEKTLAKTLKESGFKVRQGPFPQEDDIIVTLPNDKTFVIEVKKTKVVSANSIAKAISRLKEPALGSHGAILALTGEVTEAARKIAQENGIKMVESANTDELIEKVSNILKEQTIQ